MPCWYFERKEIRDSPSLKQGIDQENENRYRREGARLILDAGTKLGLRYDTCATGVTYFHRFYMTHSFREFHRYVMSACCLFLAGKVEETPKKARDIIRTVQSLLKDDVFAAAFGEDPREEVMTMERILLQTVKFDLQVEHPYGFLLSFCKQIKGDKDKIQKMAQMSWTFINDSLCTTLCLQWEPEIIAVSLMYLASRLTKFEPTDWTGRVSGSRSKWWEDIIEGLTMELMEDICHQVLDLYSAQQQAQKMEARGVSPPLAPGPKGVARPTGPRDTPPPPPRDPPPPPKRTRNASPGEPLVAGNKTKKVKHEREDSDSRQNTPAAKSAASSKTVSPIPKAGPSGGAGYGGQVSAASINPYVSSSMYSSSFMSQEGQQSIASLLGGNSSAPIPAAPQQQYPSYPPPSTPTQYPPPPGPYTPASYPSGGYAPPPGQYHTPPPYSGASYTQTTPSTYPSAAPSNNAPPSTAYQPPPTPYSAPPPNIPPPGQGYHYPPPMGQPPPSGPPPPFPPPGFGAPPPGNYRAPPPPMSHRGRGNRPNQSNLAQVRCVTERGGMR
ncbi:cyclin-K-like [Littorina saxatilis]|uniref:cyclin-K-like n=1 Tax=Littorina saxatilis TaxID=31220 RepID=UPI0038B5C972